MLCKWKKAVLHICLICALKDAKVMPSRVRIWLDTIFLRFSGPSTITSVLSELRSRKLAAIQVFMSLRHSCSVFQKNNSRLLEEIKRQQQDLLGVDGSMHSVEFLSSGSDQHQHNVVSCRPTVRVLSPDDGKQSIVHVAQQLCRSVENKERSFKDINVSMLDLLLRESKNIPDPELVVKFGPVNSTLGFLPWHIRLTEFISLPSHRNISYEDLLGVLQRYGACQQRLGQ
uniref:ditrans,polycis-polyprenyl diphosphate synthase [(2E,6E)-farnesyldiphosphate specific] n=1 Tax=Haplochromis burtoni TaxID=8153 RepID=A0A3Q2UZL7_HAPBU